MRGIDKNVGRLRLADTFVFLPGEFYVKNAFLPS